MYGLFDMDDNFTGHTFDCYGKALDALDHCPIGWYAARICNI